jgi:cytochrome c-type biogenesis protein CcmH
MAVDPRFKLSGTPRVRIEARISRSGNATPASGDLIGSSEPIPPGAADVSLQIDQVRP